MRTRCATLFNLLARSRRTERAGRPLGVLRSKARSREKLLDLFPSRLLICSALCENILLLNRSLSTFEGSQNQAEQHFDFLTQQAGTRTSSLGGLFSASSLSQTPPKPTQSSLNQL